MSKLETLCMMIDDDFEFVKRKGSENDDVLSIIYFGNQHA